jgi:hypothetical protein
MDSCEQHTIVQALSPRDERRVNGHRDTLEEQEGSKEGKMSLVIGAGIGAELHFRRLIAVVDSEVVATVS